MTELEKWFAELIRQREQNDASWFLNRPSLRASKEKEMSELA